MTAVATPEAKTASAGIVLTKAVARVVERLGINRALLWHRHKNSDKTSGGSTEFNNPH
ncbi:MAG: hypothetical protein WCJ76_14755 [Comamonadaceae bacterium]